MATATPHTPGETTATPDPKGVGGRFKHFREKHHLAFEVAFFFAGFLFDVVLLHRIDSTPLLIHQGVYLVLSALLIFVDHRIHVRGKEPEGFLGKLAGYRLWAMHFFLGTLLNAFMVFYFRSSSGFFAMLFIIALAGVIVLNELPRFRQRGPVVRVALLSFCTTSFFAYLIPVVWGSLRSWQYYLSLVVGSALTVGLWKLFRRFTEDPNWTLRRAVLPGLAVQTFLLVMYMADAIPPVPLSLKFIDVGYDAGPAKVAEAPPSPPPQPGPTPTPEPAAPDTPDEAGGDEGAGEEILGGDEPPPGETPAEEAPPPEVKPETPKGDAPPDTKVATPPAKKPKKRRAINAEYQLSVRPAPFYKPWRSADSELEIVKGEKVWVAVRIFAPSAFNDRITYRWERYDARGWHRLSSFSSSVTGGREHGFRSQAYIQNGVTEGDYRVLIETADGREIGRKSFTVTLVEPGTERETKQLTY